MCKCLDIFVILKKIVSFILIFAGVLMLFNLILDYLAKTWISENKKK